MPTNIRTSVSVLSLLAICAVSPSHAGTWGSSYWGQMLWGDLQSEFETEPKFAPSSVSIESDSGDFIVSFDFDSSNGNDGWSLVGSYDVACTNTSDGQDVVEASGPAAPIAVEGLTPDEEYSCLVTAMNQYGDSPPSSAVSATPESIQGLNIILIKSALDAKNQVPD